MEKAYEKIMDGVWSLKGVFELVDYKVVYDGKRNVFRFILKLTNLKNISGKTENVRLLCMKHNLQKSGKIE